MIGDEKPFTLGEILKAHRVEQLGPWTAKCHACDDWTEGTIHDHHADLARAFFATELDRAAAEALEDAATECWHGQGDFVGKWLRDRAAALRAALPAEPTGEGT